MRTAATVSALTALLLCAPVARADPTRDGQFWSFLQMYGLASHYPSEAYAVARGKATCGMFQTGYDWYDWPSTNVVVRDADRFSDFQAGEFAGAAIAAFCPQYMHWLVNVYADIPLASAIV